MDMMELPAGCCYQVSPGFEQISETEIARRAVAAGRSPATEISPGLWFVEGPALAVAFVSNVWFEPRVIPVSSIGKAASALRELGPWWSPWGDGLHRRQQLIADKLLRYRLRDLTLPLVKPLKSLGAFTLLDQDRLLAAPRTQRPFPQGQAPLLYDHQGPPSRAYSKIIEAVMLTGVDPKSGQTALDLGGSPGAWTWTLANCGMQVTGVDKAPFDAGVIAMSGVQTLQQSAFALDPREWEVDWLCSDIICYPERLLNLIDRWQAHGVTKNYIITVKLQGETDFVALEQFQSLPDSQLVHLSHNKHEVTWIKVPGLVGNQACPWPWQHEQAAD